MEAQRKQTTIVELHAIKQAIVHVAIEEQRPR